MIWDYTTTIRMPNPGTTCLVGVEVNAGVTISRGFMTISRFSEMGGTKATKGL